MDSPVAGNSAVVTDSDGKGGLRARVRSTPVGRQVYRVVVGLVGTAVTVLGLVLIPFPGPGWLIVFAGLAILASEFAWAQRLLDHARRQVSAWTAWLGRQNLAVRALVLLGIVLLVVAVFWGLFALSGVPTWLPDVVENQVARAPGL